MKQILKKSWLLTLGLLLTFIFMMQVLANTSAANDRVVALSDRTTKNVTDNLTITSQQLKTLGNGKAYSTDENDWNPHTIHWADFDPSSEMKVVTYSGDNADKWKTLTTKQAAIKWEANNPGWIVVAGINGDFFDINSTGQPTGNFMQSGDMYRAQTAGEVQRKTIGWNADGSVIVGDPTISTTMSLKVLTDDSKVKDEVVISTINKTPTDAGVTLLTNHMNANVDLTGFNVYDCEYSINRISSGGYIFVKGKVLGKVELGAGSVPGDDHFYLVSKDNTLDEMIAAGDLVKCEYSYTDNWSNVQNSIGYIHQVLNNGAPIPEHAGSKDAFIYTTHPRTLIGFREDGSTVFMAVEGRGKPIDRKVGVSLYEAGEILADLGCVTGYNLDGGGSTTLIARNPLGGFDVINDPSDGNERADGNHCLVVMRDPGFRVNDTESEFDRAVVKLDVTDKEAYDKISNIKVTLNGETKDYTGEELIFTNVMRDTDYEIKVTYDGLDAYDAKTITSSTYAKVSVPEYDAPNPGLSISKVNGSSVEITKDETLAHSSWIKNVVVYINDVVYQMGDNSTILCDELKVNTEYEIYYSFDVHDPSGHIIPVTTAKFTFKTLAYNLPNIVSISESLKTSSTLVVKYQYEDENKVVTNAYILCDDTQYPVDKVSGTVSINGLDFANNSYEVKLVLEYKNEAGRTVMIESEPLVYDATNVEPAPKPSTGCNMASVEVFISLISLTAVLGFVLRKRS